MTQNIDVSKTEKNVSNINCRNGRSCTGCGVCFAACPAGAVSIELNKDGFLEAYASVDKCIGCGLCKKVCSKYDGCGAVGLKELLQPEKERKGEIYGASSSTREIRMKCSSGGLGYEIAALCLKEGFIICGAGYDAVKGITRHAFAGDEKDLEAFNGSKYMQSYTSEAFPAFEKDKRYVVFGTPCQIYSLHKYLELKGIIDNFILVDFFCHGVPSRLLWDKYIEHLKQNYNLGRIKNVNFRDKKTGWHNYSMHIEGENHEYDKNMEDDLFYNFFLSDVCLNKSCYDCSFRRGDMRSDIRLGDFWGSKYKDNREGISIVIGNTEKGMGLVKKLQKSMSFEKATIEELLASQPQAPIPVPGNRAFILDMLRMDNSLRQIYRKTLMKNHMKYKVKATLKRLVPADLRTALKKLKG